MKIYPLVSWFILVEISVQGTYRYNTFSATPSPIETVNHLVRELRKEVSDIRKEMKTKLEVVKYEINCEIKNLRDELMKDRRLDGPRTPAGLLEELEDLKKKIKKSLRNVAEQGNAVKNELRSQKAEMYAIRNSVYDSREDLIEKSNTMLRSLRNTNGSFMCYLNDLRMHLFKINTNFAMLKKNQERMKDLIQMAHRPGDGLEEPWPTDKAPTEDGRERYLPGCTTNPLETQETLHTFRSGPVFSNFSTYPRGRGKEQGYHQQYTTPKPTYGRERIRGREGIITLFPTPLEECQDSEKKYLEYPPMPRDCADVYDLGFMESGVYRIQPQGLKPREALCDHKIDGGGWTVIVARREVPRHIHFNRTWEEYEEGFGEATREYWIGLKSLYVLTRYHPHELRAEMEDWEGHYASASYNYMLVAGPEDKYRLRVSGYAGNAGDSLRHSHLQMFSTIDQDNDQEDWGSCAAGRGGGGWWWGRCACTQPTGQYQKGKHPKPEKGITWWHWKNTNYSLKTILIMIRPRDWAN